jgi:outer membrane receptor protein involved in Fe transport
MDYFDVSGTWTARPGLEFRFGVNNVFDKNPPTMDSNTWGISAPAFGNGNTFPGTYDSLGRTFFIGVTAKY